MEITKQPTLSFVIPARNDAFTGNFKWRLETTLNYLAGNLLKLDRLDETEVVICDWGSEEPLHTALCLDRAARKISRFVLIPPEIAHQLQKDSEFPVVLAQNTAIRRCRGEYIAQIDSDILFTIEFLKALFEILEKRRDIGVPADQSLIVAKRYHVPFKYVSNSPPIHELDWFIRHFKRFLPLNAYEGKISSTTLTLMRKELWKECGGYDERMIYRGGMEVDLGHRITRKYPWFDMTTFGLFTFHLEHIQGRKLNTRKWNTWSPENLPFHPNSRDWGLNSYSLEEFIYSQKATDIEQEEPAEKQSIRLNRILFFAIARVFYNRYGLLKRMLYYYAVGKHRAITIRQFFRDRLQTWWSKK